MNCLFPVKSMTIEEAEEKHLKQVMEEKGKSDTLS